MPKALTLGNGNVLIGLDEFGQVYDLYYPHVGLENHVGGKYSHKIGVFIEGQFSWLEDGSWDISVESAPDTLLGHVTARSASLSLELIFDDTVYNEKTILIRHLTVNNLADRAREVKVYINHEFEIYESHRGDTAYYDPIKKVLIHYKGRRLFLANIFMNGQVGIQDYSIGLLGMEGKEGTYKDAEDGYLTKNPIEHGLVDSVCGMTFNLKGHGTGDAYYWLIMAKSMAELYATNAYAIEKTPSYLMESTTNYWRAWGGKEHFSFYGLDRKVVELFNKSLFIIRTHVDNHGAILASGDSDMLKHGRDTYSYMWPRDAAFTAMALDRARYTSSTRLFFNFCSQIIMDEGYFMHKYRADGSLGSSWHPWLRGKEVELPIQEDETAMVILALWRHYLESRQIEEIEVLYNPLIRKSADFLSSFMDEDLGLPHPSYDLWEEKFGISTFTCGAVAAALQAAAKFSEILGKKLLSEKYLSRSNQIKENSIKHLYSEKEGHFIKMLMVAEGGTRSVDRTLDMSSLYAAFKFGLLPLEDPRLANFVAIAESKLKVPGEVGGYARYEQDMYFRQTGNYPGNPWFITTLWLTQYYIAIAKSAKDLDVVLSNLNWVTKHAALSGVLSEQLHPSTGGQLSAAPLTWSHAEYVITVIEYLEKLEELGVSETSLPPK